MRSTSPATRYLSLASLLFLCVAGLLIAIHLQGTEASVCQSSGCQAVLDSRYSHVGHWPIALFGVGFYTTMILLWAGLASTSAGRLRRAVLLSTIIICSLAIAVSLFLVGLQFFVIHALCPLCLTSAAICVAMGWTTFHLLRHVDWRSQPLAGAATAMILLVLGFHFFPAPALIVARIGRQTIPRAQMESEIATATRQAQWETYRAEKDWLDQKITDLLVRREAGARHITPAELVQRELNDPVDQQLDQFMKKNSDKLNPEDRAIVRQQMQTRFKADRAEAFVHQLMRKYDAVEYLSPPILDEKDLAAIPGPHRGGNAQTAPIRLVIFSDFGCEYCAHTSQSIAAAMKRYGDRISLTFHYLPLAIHYRSQDAAIAAECAAEQNKFWPFHDALMSHGGQLGGIDFLKTADDLGLNQSQFRECLSGATATEMVNQSKRRADQLGIDATPAVFLNGQRIGGDLSEVVLMDWIARIHASVPAATN